MIVEEPLGMVARPVVFLNYRSEDEASTAVLLDRMLSEELGEDAVFLDYRSIPLGRDFVPALLDAVRQSAVLLAVIGRQWSSADECGGRLIDDPDDWVRREVLAGLAAGIRLVPVLVGDRSRLRVEELPAELAELARLQYARIRHRSQVRDIRALIDSLAAESPRIADRIRYRAEHRSGTRDADSAVIVSERTDADLGLDLGVDEEPSDDPASRRSGQTVVNRISGRVDAPGSVFGIRNG